METGVDGTAPVLRILGLMVKDTKRKRGVFGMGRNSSAACGALAAWGDCACSGADFTWYGGDDRAV